MSTINGTTELRPQAQSGRSTASRNILGMHFRSGANAKSCVPSCVDLTDSELADIGITRGRDRLRCIAPRYRPAKHPIRRDERPMFGNWWGPELDTTRCTIAQRPTPVWVKGGIAERRETLLATRDLVHLCTPTDAVEGCSWR
jgi:hypothetical protein